MPSRRGRVAVTADRMVDGGRGSAPAPVLLIENGQIAMVGLRGEPLPPDVELVDLGDVTIMPGFVDVHAHLALDGRPDAAQRLDEMSDARILHEMRAAARSALYGGITTLRDLGAPRLLGLTARDQLAAGAEPAPHVVAAGPPVTVPGGHAHYLGGGVAGVREVRTTVRELHEAGVDLIKVMASGGRLTPGSDTSKPQFSTEEMGALVDDAHDLGLPVTAHAYPPAAIEQVVDCGVDGIEHCFFSVDGGLAPDPELIDRIAAAGTAVCPTLGLVPDWTVPPGFRAFLDVFGQVVSDMRARGVRLVAGVDSGALPGKPHDALPYALIEFARLGMTNAEALYAGTAAASDVCGLGYRKGALRPGFDADIIAVRGTPLAHIEDVSQVCFVMVGGTVVRDDRGDRPAPDGTRERPGASTGLSDL
ncbi:MAG: amidohydrolase family protein [Pseudonocardiaceae bacterium]